MAEAIVRPSSWTALQPASLAWYPVIEIGLKRGSVSAANCTTSAVSRIEGPGGKMNALRARNSFRMSFWSVPVSWL